MNYEIFLLKGIIGGLIGIVVLMLTQYIFILREFDKINAMLKRGTGK